jgi:hypothetical protein
MLSARLPHRLWAARLEEDTGYGNVFQQYDGRGRDERKTRPGFDQLGA